MTAVRAGEFPVSPLSSAAEILAADPRTRPVVVALKKRREINSGMVHSLEKESDEPAGRSNARPIMTTGATRIPVASTAGLNSFISWHALCTVNLTLHFFPRMVQASGSELMSPATIIQTHTAYEGIDDKHPSVAGSDSSRFHHAAKSTNDGFDAGKAIEGVDVSFAEQRRPRPCLPRRSTISEDEATRSVGRRCKKRHPRNVCRAAEEHATRRVARAKRRPTDGRYFRSAPSTRALLRPPLPCRENCVASE